MPNDTEDHCFIFGQSNDPHMIEVGKRVRSLGRDCVLVDFYNHPDITFLADGSVSINDRLLTSESKFYWRFKPRLTPIDGLDEYDAKKVQFWIAQWQTVFRAVSHMHPESHQICSFDTAYSVQNKPYQLFCAVKAGFDIPKSIISNQLNKLEQFCAPSNRYVFKSMTLEHSPKGVLLTTEINWDTICNNSDAIVRAPNLFQEFVEKDFEVRALVSTTDCVATRIDVAKTSDSYIDWRLSQSDPSIYSAFSLPNETLKKCRKFMKEMGLKLGVFDLIVNPEGKYVFLECNIGGQWLFIEQHTKQPFTQAVASSIVSLGAT